MECNDIIIIETILLILIAMIFIATIAPARIKGSLSDFKPSNIEKKKNSKRK